ncbi:hypothetical protein ACFO4O_06995 [Glaciecola siphonariae]|uniref:Uncharacterized protein n=1 Tax=Glaciecola siphonariae TaxID=521012 RepID=A0ABV9LUN2_9ALTE
MSDSRDMSDKNRKNNDDIDIVSGLYQELEKEIPSNDLDKRILAMAKAHSRSQDVRKNADATSQQDKKKAPKRSFLAWQYSGAVAASILLVVLLVQDMPWDYISEQDMRGQQESFDHALSAPIIASDSQVNAPEVTAEEVTTQALQIPASVEQAKRMGTADLFAESAPSPSNARLEARAQKSEVLESEVLESQVMQSIIQTNIPTPKASSTSMRVQALEEKAEIIFTALMAYLQPEGANQLGMEDEVVSELGSELNTQINNEINKEKNNELDGSLLETQPARKDNNQAAAEAEIQARSDAKAQVDFQDKQLLLFNTLQELKNEQVNWRLDDKYLLVLSAEQVDALNHKAELKNE